MIECRFFSSFGGVDYGWFNVKYYFLFVSYYDFKCMGWGVLCVWNDDIIVLGIGFLLYLYGDMEIIIYVCEGVIIYCDNLGNVGCIEVGDVQVMSVGSGIIYSEYNLELGIMWIFQIWIILIEIGKLLLWGVKLFLCGECLGRFVVLVSGFVEDVDVLFLCIDVCVLGVMLKVGESIIYVLVDGCQVYLVLLIGLVEINGVKLDICDGVVICNELVLCVMVLEDVELVLVDVVV